ncbi:MAG: hypothetical protein K2X93_00955 [Candidatus Obscuribacterales bacterium]|nr:hypothetical protein [Candidatus Obscuribacterales bacterium]
MEQNRTYDDTHTVSRRAVLKVIASAPITLAFGLTASPFMRFFKPTMKPFEVFQAADLPVPSQPFEFFISDFPEVWTCIPFNFKLSYVEFNPEGRVQRDIPSFIVRLPDRFVGYSRRCPYYKCVGLLEFLKDRGQVNCGCAPGDRCCCVRDVPYNPVLYCPRHRSVFDLADNCRAVHGPTERRPRELELRIAGDVISVTGLNERSQTSSIV